MGEITSDSDVVELLYEAYWDEWESAMNYLAWANALDGVLGETISNQLQAEVTDEINHAQEIASRLEVLDKVPPGSEKFTPTQSSLQPPAEPTVDSKAVIDGVIEAETEAIELYSRLAKVAEENGDRVTRNLAERLLEDEEVHLSEFEGYKEEYKSRS